MGTGPPVCAGGHPQEDSRPCRGPVQLEQSSGGGGWCQVRREAGDRLCKPRIRSFHLERSRIVRWIVLEVGWGEIGH